MKKYITKDFPVKVSFCDGKFVGADEASAHLAEALNRKAMLWPHSLLIKAAQGVTWAGSIPPDGLPIGPQIFMDSGESIKEGATIEGILMAAVPA
jgi:hypothetical protein